MKICNKTSVTLFQKLMLNKIKVWRGCTFSGTNLKENFIEAFRKLIVERPFQNKISKFYYRLDEIG